MGGDVDISGMPEPGAIGLDPAKQADPSDGMPEPEDLYRKFHFGGGIPNANGKMGPMEPIPKDALDDFMANPPKNPTLKETASRLTGLPRAAAGYALAVPAGVASIAGQATGALGAAVDPENASSYLEQGRDRGRRWASNVYDYAKHVPATKLGGEFADDLMGAPGKIIKEAADSTLGRVMPDNAYQALSDVAQDVGTDLPGLGAPGVLRAGARGIGAAASVVKRGIASEKATITPPEPAAPLTAPVGSPVTGDTLRAQPNPIPPPEGTNAHARAQPAEPPAAAAETPPAAPKQPPKVSQPAAEPAPTAEQPPAPVGATKSPGDDQRGSVRLFNSPAEEGPKETPTPDKQTERAAHLDALDKLSSGGLPTRRTSALTGDYNATGNDWQMKEVGNKQMQGQLASENSALHTAMDTVHQSVGSEFKDSVDPTVLGDRGRTTRGAIHGIQDWFKQATDDTYKIARANTSDAPMPNFLKRADSFLKDDANYMPESFRKAAQTRLQQLKTGGDNGDGDPSKAAAPSSIGAAEKFREWLNKNRTLDNMHTVRPLVEHTDTDVAEHGGPGLFTAARALRTHSAQMLEEPTGIKKLLAPGDSQGINHAIKEHEVMDYISNLDRQQHEHVLNVLRAGAHLGKGELAESSAAAIREIQAHTLSRMHAAATNDGGKWNARSFYDAANRYGRNAASTFKDRPDILSNLKTVNDAGNVLHMDKHYAGAVAQGERTGALGHALETGGNIVSSLAHHVPVVGRIVGKAIESGVEGLGGRVSESSRDAAVSKSLVDRNGKMRGSVQVMGDKEESPPVRLSASPQGVTAYSANGSSSAIRRGNDLHMRASTTEEGARGKGESTARLTALADHAHDNGGILHSDNEVSAPEQGPYGRLGDAGYSVKTNPHTTDPGTGVKKSAAELKGVYEVRPKQQQPLGATVGGGNQRGSAQIFNDNDLSRGRDSAKEERNPRSEFNSNRQLSSQRPRTAEQNDILNRLSGGYQRGSVRVMNEAPQEEGTGSQLNVGLHQGVEGEKGFRKMSKQEAQSAVESTGAKVTKTSVLTPKQHGVSEPTAVMSTDRPLSNDEMQGVLAKTKQSAIPQRADSGDESMHIAPGHEQVAKEQGWNSFSPDYFREHDGRTMSATMENPKNIHPGTTVRDPKRSAYPGIYDDPKDIMDRLAASKNNPAPESPHLKDIFGTTRKEMHDEVVAKGDVAPKTPMPGMAEKGKGSAHAQQVTTPENAERLRDTISAFRDRFPEAYHGMVSWYHMDPMFHSIKKILGGDADKAGDVFHKLNTYTALASPMSSVGPEIRRGTAAATMSAEGDFKQFADHGGNPTSKAALKKAPALQTQEMGVEGHAFHGTAQAPAMTRFNETGAEANAPKTGAYRRASDASSRPGSEHQNTVLVGDSHFSRGVGLADVRGAKAFDGSIDGTELKTVHPWYHESVAKPLGIPSTSTQAAQWGALSHETGVESPIGAPKLEIFANEIADAAKRAGVEPKEMWQRIVKRLSK